MPTHSYLMFINQLPKPTTLYNHLFRLVAQYADEEILRAWYDEMAEFIRSNKVTSEHLGMTLANVLSFHSMSPPDTTMLYPMFRDYPDIDCNTRYARNQSIFEIACLASEELAIFLLRNKEITVTRDVFIHILRLSRFNLAEVLLDEFGIQPLDCDIVYIASPVSCNSKYQPGDAAKFYRRLPKSDTSARAALVSICSELLLHSKHLMYLTKCYSMLIEFADAIFADYPDGHSIYKKTTDGYTLLTSYLKTNYCMNYGHIDCMFINKLLQKGVDPFIPFPTSSVSHALVTNIGVARGGMTILQRLVDKESSKCWYRRIGAVEMLGRLFSVGIAPEPDCYDEHLKELYNKWLAHKNKRIRSICNCLDTIFPHDVSVMIAVKSLGINAELLPTIRRQGVRGMISA